MMLLHSSAWRIHLKAEPVITLSGRMKGDKSSYNLVYITTEVSGPQVNDVSSNLRENKQLALHIYVHGSSYYKAYVLLT